MHYFLTCAKKLTKFNMDYIINDFCNLQIFKCSIHQKGLKKNIFKNLRALRYFTFNIKNCDIMITSSKYVTLTNSFQRLISSKLLETAQYKIINSMIQSTKEYSVTYPGSCQLVSKNKSQPITLTIRNRQSQIFCHSCLSNIYV